MIIPETPILPVDRKAEYTFLRSVRKICTGHFIVAKEDEPISPVSGGRLYVASVDDQDELCIKFSDGRVVVLST